MTNPRLLGDRYELGAPLGHGGMAEVFRGRDVRLGRDVAIKILRQDLARDPSFQTRFRREAQASASLNHPSIVAVYDTGEDPSGPTPYIVMEYVEGRTLREILSAEGRLQPRRAMEITSDVCAALAFSHRNGIVHRDVKPGNVMITARSGTEPSSTAGGSVKVMDFGIARAVTDSAATVTSTAQVIGTAQYLSPEQARGEAVDARSDVYSVGCMLYELLTGSPPFTGDSPVAVAYQHVREDPAAPSSINPDVPPELDRVVLKAMAKNPANRYQSAADMRADLQRAIAGRPVTAEAVLPPEERTAVMATTPMGSADDAEAAERSKRRRAIGFALLALAVVAIFVGAALAVPRLLDSEDNNPTVAQKSVPSLTGLTEPQAKRELTAAGLKLGDKTTAESTTANKGKVIDQEPSPESEIDEGSEVAITIGAGPNTVAVPQVAGLTLEAAKQQLRDSNLVVGGTVPESNKVAANTVLRSSPAEGNRVPEGTPITLVVSSGKVGIPSVYGETLNDAYGILNQAGFSNIAEPQEQESSDAEPGTVIGQDPPPGTEAGTDIQITLTVAVAPPSPTQTTPSPTPTPPPSSSEPPPSSPPSSSPPSSSPPASPPREDQN